MGHLKAKMPPAEVKKPKSKQHQLSTGLHEYSQVSSYQPLIITYCCCILRQQCMFSLAELALDAARPCIAAVYHSSFSLLLPDAEEDT